MGYTHYWTQKRNLTRDEWTDITTDIGDILKYAQHETGIPLADMMGDTGTSPEFLSTSFGFNGLGDDAHESFRIPRVRERDFDGGYSDFTKTDRNHYDDAVTACLCYLDTCLDKPAFHITSDGHGQDFLTGLDIARKAIPRKANVLDIPMGVMQEDRWTAPWIYQNGVGGYSVLFCVNGKGYVTKHGRQPEHYCFESHLALAEYLDANKESRFKRFGHRRGISDYVEPDLWQASGSFDHARYERIAKGKVKVLSKLFPVMDDHAEAPPLFVRPNQFPDPRENGTFCYNMADIFRLYGTQPVAGVVA